jgi:predicted AlkP superfamily phosphohydrolase/phosphomutase
MNRPDLPSMLAIGIDAAESTLVRKLVDANQLPALRRLAEQGCWRTVDSPSDIGSGSVWPTFMTGAGPSDHGIHAEWMWSPESMTVYRCDGRNLRPFWASLADSGIRVGMLDVPFAPLLGMRDGFEIKEWGPHDAVDGRPSAGPVEVAELLKRLSPHPFYSQSIDPSGPTDVPALEALVAACLRGVAQRGDLVRQLISTFSPDLVIAAFTEIHHASHHLWQTIAADHALYSRIEIPTSPRIESGLTDLYREVDREIGMIVAAAGPDAAVLVFSLHGMRPATGIAAFLGPVLCERGFARLASWASQSSRERLMSAFAAAKRHSPAFLKKLYYHIMPATTTRMLARPTMMPAYDWSATQAFALPSDQHGWIRINLAGREAAGTVPLARYEETCRELEALVADLTDSAGHPLATKTIRTSADAERALTSGLPDLVVHWADAALVSPLLIRGSRVTASTIGQKFTSQHALSGFCIWRGPGELPEGPMPSTKLHGLFRGRR